MTPSFEDFVAEEARIAAAEADSPNSPDYDGLVEKYREDITFVRLCAKLYLCRYGAAVEVG